MVALNELYVAPVATRWLAAALLQFMVFGTLACGADLAAAPSPLDSGAPGSDAALRLDASSPVDASTPVDAAQAGDALVTIDVRPLPIPITSDAILLEMVDAFRQASLPSTPWRSYLSSSYDRRSITPGTPEWFSNSDFTGAVREEGAERVLLDVDGPGAITRVWSADPNGRLRIYLDNATTPIVDAEAADLLEGRVSPFEAPFSFTVAVGRNLVYPIPFAGHAKVTTTAPKMYVNIDSRLYAPGTPVVTFAGGEAIASRERRAAEAAMRGEYASTGGRTRSFTLASEGAGPSVRIEAESGGSAITTLALSVDRIDANALRRTMVVATFDGEKTVQTPLGDLFAFDPAGIDVRALPLSADHNGRFALRFPMPFEASATLELVDVGGGPVRAQVTAEVVPFAWNDRSLHFHARWTGVREHDVFTPHLFRVATITGAGRYVGTVLHVANPHPGWCGEGDEQIWVDGEPFPSHFGTGTEDYFGYAYCSTERFSHPLFGQTRANTNDFAGYISLYRFLTSDAVPFNSALKFDLETLHWETSHSHPVVAYDAVYYFYARPGAVVEDAERVPSDFVIPTLPEGTVKTGDGWTRWTPPAAGAGAGDIGSVTHHP